MKFIILLLFSTRLFAVEVMVDRIVAVVNEEVITSSDLHKYKETFGIRKGSMSEDEFNATINSNEKLLNKLIDERLISQHVAEKDMKVTEDEINDAINRILKQYNMTIAQLKMQLEHEKIPFDTFKGEKKKEIEVSKVLEELKRAVNITDDDLKKYFKTKTNEDVYISEYRIQVILASKEENIKKAQDAIKAGTDFNEAVRKYSEDDDTKDNNGDLGFLNPNALIQELRAPVLGMSINDVKGPIKVKSKTGFDYYLIKLAEVKNTENPRYTNNKDDLRRELMGNEISRQLALWLERIKSESYVRINSI